MRRLITLSLLLLSGCTVNDALPDKANVNMTIDADTYDARSYTVGVQWDLPKAP